MAPPTSPSTPTSPPRAATTQSPCNRPARSDPPPACPSASWGWGAPAPDGHAHQHRQRRPTATGVSLAGPDASSFSIGTNGCTGAVAVGGSCNVQVSFTPTATGDRTASLVVTANDPASPHTIPLTGRACPRRHSTWPTPSPRPRPRATSVQTNTVGFVVSLSSTPGAAGQGELRHHVRGQRHRRNRLHLQGGTLNFSAGASGAALTQTVNGQLLGDAARRVRRDFFVQLYNPTGGPRCSVARPGDHRQRRRKPPTGLSVSDAEPRGAEGNPPPTTQPVLRVTLSASPRGGRHGALRHQYGTATAGSDYEVPSESTLTFAAGTTDAQPVRRGNHQWRHRPPRADETFSSRSTTRGATIGDAYGRGMILNDDIAPPVLSIADATPSGGRGQLGHRQPRRLTVTLSATPTTDVVVSVGDHGCLLRLHRHLGSRLHGRHRQPHLPRRHQHPDPRGVCRHRSSDTVVEPVEWFYVQIYNPSAPP